MAEIQLKHVRKTYPGNVQVIPDLNLEIRDKEFVVFVGPSGCGKSTTLRMIAGLEEITDGELYIGGRLVNQVLPKDRDIAMVFQNYALYPHMTVYRNMAFGLQLRKTPKDEIDRKVREAARILDLEKYLERKPKALSGGQRQRVALGRAMVRNPSVFLLDEPLSNLDAKLRTAMRSEIIKLHKRLQTTFIYVTHDQVEAMTMGDRICVLRDGVVQQFDTPQRLFERPSNLFVAGFIGSPQMNLVQGVLERLDSAWWFVAPGLRLEVPVSVSEQWQPERLKNQLPVVLGIRPEDLDLATGEDKPDLVVSCELSEMMGSERYLYLKRAEEPDSRNWIARISSREPWNEDSQVRIRVNRERLYCFERETGRNLLPEGQEAPESRM